MCNVTTNSSLRHQVLISTFDEHILVAWPDIACLLGEQ
jgi:hypothetical protein